MKTKLACCALALMLAAVADAHAQPAAPTANTVPVTVDNFTRAESDLYFRSIAVKEGGFGKFFHNREPAPIDNQNIIRLNRDTLYSGAVFDLDAGPVTITLPDAGKRFMSMQVIDEDEYTHGVFYGAGGHTLTKEGIGTRYVVIAVRTLVDPTDPKDVGQVRVLQDAIKFSQKSAGKFIYLNVTPPNNDGKTIYRLTVKDVPVDGFWSVSVYNAAGYYEKNPYNAYSLNNITAKKSDDGAIAIQFGGCDGKITNCLPTVPGWNYTVRLYRPRPEIVSGKWTFPQPQPML